MGVVCCSLSVCVMHFKKVDWVPQLGSPGESKAKT